MGGHPGNLLTLNPSGPTDTSFEAGRVTCVSKITAKTRTQVAQCPVDVLKSRIKLQLSSLW